MKTLLVKDYRILMTQKKSFFILLLVGVIMVISTFEIDFLTGYMMMMAMVLSLGTVNYDELDNGMAFIMTLPANRKTYAIEKYVFTMINIVACAAIMLMIYFITKGFVNWQFGAGDMVSITAGWICGIMIASSVMIPLYLKFGAEKRRVVMMLLWGVVAVIAIGGQKLAEVMTGTEAMNTINGFLAKISTLPVGVVVLAVVAVLVMVVIFSLGISVGIMKKKEF
ncbi:MAG: ABC-2 transporter permease [Lachnospiraceae bacterium]|nr:ABC-2 transporter permease [Lachnospiraceae bacterium]